MSGPAREMPPQPCEPTLDLVRPDPTMPTVYPPLGWGSILLLVVVSLFMFAALVACAPTHPEARHIVATTTTVAPTTTTQAPAPAVSAAPRASRKAARPRGPSPSGAVATSGDALLACIRSYEGAYTTNTGNGFYGAYQFDRPTWRGAVARAGYPEWSNRLPSDAPPHVQDAAAAQLVSERGLQPWPTPNRRCR